jgi:uncharacterized damage-inducible protein DinB
MKNRTLQALMDEYRRAAADYKKVLDRLEEAHFEQIYDTETSDMDCKSIQGVTFHIIQSGYTYANYINTLSTKEWHSYKKMPDNAAVATVEIEKMLDYTELSFAELWAKTDDELAVFSFDTRWGVRYDLEQLLEHAIVHILRHRRQIENFISAN